PDEVIADVLAATAAGDPHFEGITLERLKREGFVALNLAATTPFADGQYPTPSGKVDLFSQALADRGYDPLPGHFHQKHDDGGLSTPNGFAPAEALTLISGASHHFVSSSFASQQGLLDNAGPPSVEIHPDDAAVRRIQPGDAVELVNGRGVCRLRAVVTD